MEIFYEELFKKIDKIELNGDPEHTKVRIENGHISRNITKSE